MDCNYTIPIDLALNEIPSGAESILKLKLQSNFGLIEPDSGTISLCVNWSWKYPRH